MGNHKRLSGSDKIYLLTVYFIVTFLLAVTLIPLIFVLNASISNPNEVASGNVLFLPKDVTLEGFRRVFRNKDIFIGYRNTIIYTVVGTILNLIVTFLAAYPLSMPNLTGKKAITIFFTIPMFFGGGLVPLYLLIKDLHLLNKPLVLMILGLTSTWNIVLVRTYMSSSIPKELQEAAYIDGCSHFGVFRRIMLPLSKPILAVMALFYAVGHWNEFFNSMIYMDSRKYYPLQLFLREILLQNEIAASSLTNSAGDLESMAVQANIAQIIKYAVMIVATIPLLIVYPFVQKFFVKGMMVGSIKG